LVGPNPSTKAYEEVYLRTNANAATPEPMRARAANGAANGGPPVLILRGLNRLEAMAAASAVAVAVAVGVAVRVAVGLAVALAEGLAVLPPLPV
jgi:hypothetical protein